MCASCRRVPFGLRVVAAVRAGAVVVARPAASSVAHLYAGPLTRSASRVPRAARTLCKARTRTLYVIGHGGALDSLDGLRCALGGRRFCRACQAATPAALALDGADTHRLVTRDEWLRAYSHLTPLDVAVAVRWAATVADTHAVGVVALMRFGAKPPGMTPTKLTPARAAVWRMHDEIHRRRRALIATERTDEERAANAAARDERVAISERARKAHANEAAIGRAQERMARGQYLTTYERELLGLPTRHQTIQETHS